MKRYFLAIFCEILGFLMLMLFVSLYKVIYLIIFFLCNSVLFFLWCPKCKKCLLYNPVNIFGLKFWTCTPWIPKRCSKCGCYMYRKECLNQDSQDLSK